MNMRNEIKNYLNEGRRRDGICGRYNEMLSEAVTARDYFDAALGVQGMAYVCASVRDGWFPGPQTVFGMFGRMVNGQYTHEGRGYTSKMYYHYSGVALADTTAVCVIESSITLKVPRHRNVRIYAAGLCNIRITGEGRANIVFFGDESQLSVEGDMDRIVKKYVAKGYAD
jgi:hypothetical protein